MSVIFARPDYDYGSYRDLYDLITLSGFPLVKFGELQPDSDNTYILAVVNGENQGGWQNPTARIILYDLEWRLEGTYPRIPGVSEVWVGDQWYSDRLQEKGIANRYVPLGSNTLLAGRTLASDPYAYFDVAYISYLTHRRERLLNSLFAHNVLVSPTHNLWGSERDQVLRASRAMLHVHQHDNAPTIAPLRWCLAAAYGLPMISESVGSMGIFDNRYTLYADYPHLAEFTKLWTRRDSLSRLADFGLALQSLLCRDYTFRIGIERNL